VHVLYTGMLWIECKQLYINGAGEHFRQYYNIMDFAIIALYLASYALRFATYYRVTEDTAVKAYAAIPRSITSPVMSKFMYKMYRDDIQLSSIWVSITV